MEAQVKAIGNLIKCGIENIEHNSEYGEFLAASQQDNLILPEVILEFHERYSAKGIHLLKVTELKTQVAVILKEFSIRPFGVQIDSKTEEFVVLHELEKIELDDIKNAAELSGCGKVLSKFELGFMDYARKFTKKEDRAFFELNPDELILNSIILTVDKNTPTLAPKLTGRAAEIAARRKNEQQEVL